MTDKEAIKYLQQLYPNGGHCWLDEQRIEAIGMAIKALQKECVSEDTMTIRKEWFEHCKKSWYNEGYIDGKHNRDNQFGEPVNENMEAEFLRAAHNLRERPLLSDWFRHFYLIGKQHSEPVSEDLEAEVKKLWMEINTGHSYSIVDSYNQFYGLCMDIADWQKEQILDCSTTLQRTFELGKQEMKQLLMAKAVNGFVIKDIEEGNGDFLLSADYLPKDMGLKDRQKVKVIVIKED